MQRKLVIILIAGLTTILLGLAVTTVYVATYIFPAFSPRWITQLPPNPPRPTVKYGEFPLRLEYEIGGERKVLEDILICEFNGFKVVQPGSDKVRDWKSHLSSGNARLTLGVIHGIEVYCFPMAFDRGLGSIYMGDGKYAPNVYQDDDSEIFPYIWKTSKYEENSNMGSTRLFADKLWEEFKIRLISWEIAEPIQNSFK